MYKFRQKKKIFLSLQKVPSSPAQCRSPAPSPEASITLLLVCMYMAYVYICVCVHMHMYMSALRPEVSVMWFSH